MLTLSGTQAIDATVGYHPSPDQVLGVIGNVLFYYI